MNETARKLVHAKTTIACLRKRIKKLEGEIAGLKHVAAGHIGFPAKVTMTRSDMERELDAKQEHNR